MGGRGQSGMSGRGRGGSGIDAIRNARSFKEVAEKAASYGIDVNYKAFENYGKFDLDTVKNSVVGIALVRQEFSQLDAIIGDTNFSPDMYGRGGSRAYAFCDIKGNISVSSAMQNIGWARVEGKYKSDVSLRWHPDGTTAQHIASHEMGHALEAALIYKAHANNPWTSEVGTEWTKHTRATKVVGEASRQVKRTPEGKGTRIGDQIESVSRYASQNRSETLAECVADYAANGSNAKPLSREVWGILKRELG